MASNPVSPWIGRELERSRQSRLHEVWHFHYPFPTGEAACLRQAARRAAAGPPAAAPRPAVICTYLMLNLTVETWLRFLIWLPLGIAIYFAYSHRRSRPGKDAETYDNPATPKVVGRDS